MDNDEELEKIASELKREKARAWRKQNKEKVKEINRRYWLKKAKQIMEERNKEEKQEG